MSAYRFIVVIGAIIFVMLLWIPLGWIFGEIATILNSGITDDGAISRNNIMVQVFYYTLFIIIIAAIIYVLKPDKGEIEQGGVAYAPPTYY